MIYGFAMLSLALTMPMRGGGVSMALTDMKRVPPLYEPQTPPSLGVTAGDKAPSFCLLSVGGKGERVALADLLQTKPVVVEFASVT